MSLARRLSILFLAGGSSWQAVAAAVPDVLLVTVGGDVADAPDYPTKVITMDTETGDLIDRDFIVWWEDLSDVSFTHATLGPAHTILVTDAFDLGNPAEVYEFDVQGNFLRIFAEVPSQTPRIRSVHVLPTGAIGIVSVTFAAILEFDPLDGTQVGYFIEPGAGGLIEPEFAIFRDSDILVSNQDRAGPDPDAIFRFDLQGNYLGRFYEFSPDLVYPYQMYECANGNVLVSTWEGGVYEVTTEGAFLRASAGIQGHGCYELANGNILTNHRHYPELWGWVAEYDRLTGALVELKVENLNPYYTQRIHGPALVGVESLADHGAAGVLGVGVDLAAEAGEGLGVAWRGLTQADRGSTGHVAALGPLPYGGAEEPLPYGRGSDRGLPEWHPARFAPMTMPGSKRTDPLPATLDPGLVTTEPRDGGIAQLRFAFEFALTDDAASLNEMALSITSEPAGAPIPAFTTALDETAHYLTITFAAPLPDQYLYTIEVTHDVTTHPGDRRFQIRALKGNVANDLGAPIQTVNAVDLGISQGVRGQFLPPGELVDASNARFDVNLDGTINAGDYSYVRLTGGVFGNTAP